MRLHVAYSRPSTVVTVSSIRIRNFRPPGIRFASHADLESRGQFPMANNSQKYRRTLCVMSKTCRESKSWNKRTDSTTSQYLAKQASPSKPTLRQCHSPLGNSGQDFFACGVASGKGVCLILVDIGLVWPGLQTSDELL